MFHQMDAQWARREHFRHYMDSVRCTYSLTVQIDITALCAALKERGYRAYPAQIYMLATIVNRFPAFRMGTTAEGEAGYWEVVHPSYTIFNAETQTFSSIWTEYQAGFAAFYEACVADMAQYGGTTKFAPKGGAPKNAFDVSSVPWVDFTAFNLNIDGGGRHLLPIFTIGRYEERAGRVLMPLAMQLHHAACDGYHVGEFVQALRAMAADWQAWL